MKIEDYPIDKGMEDQTTVLVMTCKKFEQCWHPFFTLFEKFWPECPYEVIMGTDTGKYKNIPTISTGTDLGWSNNCIEIIKKINKKKIIMFFEDFLPCKKFDNERIRKLVKYSIDQNVGCLRLQPCPGPTADWEDCESLGILQSQDNYRFSLQTAIWDKSTLLNLLKYGENPWQTEINGTKRASQSKDLFLSVKRGESPIPYIITAVVKGRWINEALDLLRRENIPMDKITKIIGR